jgi:hypothetical protein
LKIGNKGNIKTNFIFCNFKDKKKWKNRGRGGGGEGGYLGRKFIKINLLAFKETKKLRKKFIF